MHHSQIKQSQSGAALLIFILLLVVGLGTVVTAVVTPGDPKIERDKQTRSALIQAKQALLGYAARYYVVDPTPGGNGPGPGHLLRLPCPDDVLGGAVDEGESNNCGSNMTNVIGKFPWKSLEIETLKDGDGECLWYVLSAGYKTSRNSISNPDTPGLLRVFNSKDLLNPAYGAQPENRVVATIIAPGKALPNQNRIAVNPEEVPHCGGHYAPEHYLEAIDAISNADLLGVPHAVDDLVSFAKNSPDGNDVIEVVTYEELQAVAMQVVINRPPPNQDNFINDLRQLTWTVAECIRLYARKNTAAGDYRLPYPAPVALPDADYSNEDLYDDAAGWPAGVPGRIPYKFDNSKAVVGNNTNDTSLFEACRNEHPDLLTSNTLLYNLWEDWKDHLFYAVAPARHPDTGVAACDAVGQPCLSIDGDASYAAVVFFAGSALLGQDRTQAPDGNGKGQIGNYLEGPNAKQAPAADYNFVTQDPAGGAAFNDLLYGIDADLTQVLQLPAN